MRRALVVLLLALAATGFIASPAGALGVLTWINPTTCADGTPLGTGTCTALTGIDVYCATTSPTMTGQTVSGTGLVSKSLGVVTTYTVVPTLITTAGTWFCAATAVDSTGQSVLSNVMSFPVAPTDPAPPTNLTAQ